MKNASDWHQPHKNRSIRLGVKTLQRQVVKTGIMRSEMGMKWDGMEWNERGMKLNKNWNRPSAVINKFKLGESPGH